MSPGTSKAQDYAFANPLSTTGDNGHLVFQIKLG
jgi:hypothetical protein